MIEQIYYGCFATAFWISGIVYANAREKKEKFLQRLLGCTAVYFAYCVVFWFLPIAKLPGARMFGCMLGLGILILFQHACWNISWSVAMYDAIWAVMSWQLISELWYGINGSYPDLYGGLQYKQILGLILLFFIGYAIAACTIARWMPEGGPKKIGPRQLISACLIFCTFEMSEFVTEHAEEGFQMGEWQVVHLSRLLLGVVLYLQNELFKKSAMRQELAMMNMLWRMEQEQYQLSKENIALINQKCHDLKHQIRAIRNASKEDIDRYLEEMEGSIQIYESIVKTGNEVLDTILTEKSLYCRERGITVSCVADGSQMGFIHTVDLYAILGNALDNAIEAVEKFKHEEKRQIDVLIYRQQNFLVINVINPLKGTLVYEEELPVTTKGDTQYHGFGLRNMRYLVKKYDGFLSVSTEDGCFSLKILMPIPTASQG